MKCGYCGEPSSGAFCSKDCRENSAVYNILEELTLELDLVHNATTTPWKVLLTNTSYDTLKNRPGTGPGSKSRTKQQRKLIYEKDGSEYLICVENHVIPFIIHARIADTNSAVDELRVDNGK